jgi:hypothetical protein
MSQRTQVNNSIPSRFVFWPEASTENYTNTSSCLFHDLLNNSPIQRNNTVTGKLVTLQWYLLKAKFSAAYTNKSILMEIAIMSPTNPSSAVLVFDYDVYLGQLPTSTGAGATNNCKVELADLDPHDEHGANQLFDA